MIMGFGARGTPNEFEPGRSAWCRNPWAADRGAKIFFMSDPSHFIKKIVNHWEKSGEPKRATSNTTRHMFVTDFILNEVLQYFPPPADKTSAHDL